MSHIINISVKNHVAKQTDQTIYVCGNNDYEINFDFDSEWDQYDVKTARFTYAGTYVDVVFTGNTCAVPVITDVWRFKVGVFAGDLSTTTPVLISASKSILCDAGAPAAPTDDVYNQIMEAVNEATTASNKAKASAEAVTPDDTTIDGKPWTSKHILDMVCPEINETGNPVQCYPVKGYPLNVTASWAPTQEGSGDPSPDNIRPITGRDSVRIQRCGENLVNIADFTLTVVNAQRTKSFFPSISLPAGTYVIDLKNTNASSNLGAQFIHDVGGAEVLANVSTFPKTVTLSKPVTQLYFYIKNTAGNSTDVSDVTITTAQAEYTPYVGITQALALPETIYGGFVANDGDGATEWKTITLDANATGCTQISTSTSNVKRILIAKDAKGTLLNANIGEVMSNCYKSISADETYVEAKRKTGVAISKAGEVVLFDSSYTTLDSFKTYCAEMVNKGTPVQIAYKLAEPTTFTATGGGELTAADGLNNILTDADSVTVKGAEDPKHTINELQDALASVTEAEG